MYVPQARVALKGTPTEFYFATQVTLRHDDFACLLSAGWM